MLRILPICVLTLGVVATAKADDLQPFRHGAWTVADTSNFRVCVTSGEAEVRELSAACEAVRKVLCGKWLGSKNHPSWQVRCHVVLHPTAASYLREVGQGQTTAGSSLVEMRGDAIVTRRVDLRADHPEGFSGALAHELTHIIVAERFVDRPIPRWADEGMAVLADSTAKQMRHYQDLLQARDLGQEFRTVELLGLADYPDATRTKTFYAQSASLVQYLVDRGTAAQFLEFVELSTERGYDAALSDVYGLGGLGDLERQWAHHAASPAGSFVAQENTSPRRKTAGG